MTFTEPAFYYLFLPAILGLYFPLFAAERRFRSLSGASALVLIGGGVVMVADSARAGMLLTVAVIACHAIALAADRRTHPDPSYQIRQRGSLAIPLYLLQFPLLVAGPIVRFRDFHAQLAKRSVGLGHFSYGVRRISIGLIKVALFARTLFQVSTPLFAMNPALLTAPAAWLAAVFSALAVYFLFSGYSDIAIGLGRMIGFRYPENFRRPYTADSMREFWRRWNITLLTWLRDYVQLPIAGHDRPTPRSYAAIVSGFCIVGWWHGAGLAAVSFGLYFGTLLAIEAAGFGRVLAGWWRPLRHAYVLAAAVVGWAIARAGAATPAFILAMLGANDAVKPVAVPDLSIYTWLLVAFATVTAGPMIPALSRWRVGVDAATTSLVMMVAATALFIWRPVAIVLRTERAGRT